MPGKRGRRGGRKLRVNRAKKMVTGEGPTFLEKIAAGGSAVAQVAKAIMPALSMINTEAKYLDTANSVAFYNAGTNDQIILLSNMGQSLADTGRIGNSILAKELYIKGHHYFLASTTVHTTQTRITVICWKPDIQDNPPTAAKLFEAPANINSAINKDYSDQYVVLYDKLFTNNAAISAATIQDAKLFKFYKKLDWHMRFDDATTGDATCNHVYLVLRSNAGTSANQSTMAFYARLNYTDN